MDVGSLRGGLWDFAGLGIGRYVGDDGELVQGARRKAGMRLCCGIVVDRSLRACIMGDACGFDKNVLAPARVHTAARDSSPAETHTIRHRNTQKVWCCGAINKHSSDLHKSSQKRLGIEQPRQPHAERELYTIGRPCCQLCMSLQHVLRAAAVCGQYMKTHQQQVLHACQWWAVNLSQVSIGSNK